MRRIAGFREVKMEMYEDTRKSNLDRVQNLPSKVWLPARTEFLFAALRRILVGRELL